jgi:hypothetical protein
MVERSIPSPRHGGFCLHDRTMRRSRYPPSRRRRPIRLRNDCRPRAWARSGPLGPAWAEGGARVSCVSAGRSRPVCFGRVARRDSDAHDSSPDGIPRSDAPSAASRHLRQGVRRVQRRRRTDPMRPKRIKKGKGADARRCASPVGHVHQPSTTPSHRAAKGVGVAPGPPVVQEPHSKRRENDVTVVRSPEGRALA